MIRAEIYYSWESAGHVERWWMLLGKEAYDFFIMGRGKWGKGEGGKEEWKGKDVGTFHNCLCVHDAVGNDGSWRQHREVSIG